MRAPLKCTRLGGTGAGVPAVLVSAAKKYSTAIRYVVKELCVVLPTQDPQKPQNETPGRSGSCLRVLYATVLWAGRGEQLQAILGARCMGAGAERPMSPMCHLSTLVIRLCSKPPYCDLRLWAEHWRTR